MSYSTEVARMWRHTETGTDPRSYLELVRYATLAASSHNTQPWKFRLAANSLTVIPDFSRRTPIVDPDDHHLFASLGCAVENIVQAAPELGLTPSVELPTDLQDGITVRLESTAIGPSPLAQMIHLRQCTRANFDAKPVPIDDLKALEAAVAGGKTSLTLLTSPEDIGRFSKLIADATGGPGAEAPEPEISRADVFTHPQPPRHARTGGHPRNVRTFPKSRDFH